MIKQTLAALALATVVSSAAFAAGTTAAVAPAADVKAATEKCEVTKEGKTTTVEVAVGACVKDGGKLVVDAPAADATVAPADKK